MEGQKSLRQRARHGGGPGQQGIVPAGRELSETVSRCAGYTPACLGLPVVVMMKATEDGVGDDLSGSLRLMRFLRAGDALLDPLVWSGVIEVGLVLLDCPIQMAPVENEETVQALSPYTTQKSFADSVGLGRLIGCG